MRKITLKTIVVKLEGDKTAKVFSSKFVTNPTGESIETEETFSARVTLTKDRYGNLTYKIQPYGKTGKCRYVYLLNTEYGCLKTTQKDYLVSFRFSRKDGILAATRHLISDAARLAILMTNEFYHHNEQ